MIYDNKMNFLFIFLFKNLNYNLKLLGQMNIRFNFFKSKNLNYNLK